MTFVPVLLQSITSCMYGVGVHLKPFASELSFKVVVSYCSQYFVKLL